MRQSNAGKPLPWWVELFFVQIGLPDKILRSLLINKKRTKNFYSNNKRNLLVIICTIFGLIYINPLIKQASNQNQCVNESKGMVKDMYDLNTYLDEAEIKAFATNFCNGGGI